MNISASFTSTSELFEFVDAIAARRDALPAKGPEASTPANEEPAATEPEPEAITLVADKPEPAKRKAKAAPAPEPAKAEPEKTNYAMEARRIMDTTRDRIGDDNTDRALHKAASDAFRQIFHSLGVEKSSEFKTQAQLDAFEVACARLRKLDDGTVGVPEEDMPF